MSSLDTPLNGFLTPLNRSFFFDKPTTVAQNLLGKYLIFERKETVLISKIVETEAYRFDEPASHAYGQTNAHGNPLKQQGRAFDLAKLPGTSYVYLNYGMYWLLNVTTEAAHIASGVLIRALEPIQGIALMRKHRSFPKNDILLTNGPGKLTQAYGINRKHHGISLLEPPLYFATAPAESFEIMTSPRVGIQKATDLLWRYYIKNNPYVSPVSFK